VVTRPAVAQNGECGRALDAAVGIAGAHTYSVIRTGGVRMNSDRKEISILIRKTHNYMYHYHGCWHPGGVCRIEIFQEEGYTPVIICTELPENNNTSITGMAECLAAEVALRHFPDAFEQLGEPFIWIECHPSVPRLGTQAIYLWVTFDSYAPRSVLRFDGRPRVALGQAHWTQIDEAVITELIAGETLERDELRAA
jgi:hypothetical protein